MAKIAENAAPEKQSETSAQPDVVLGADLFGLGAAAAAAIAMAGDQRAPAAEEDKAAVAADQEDGLGPPNPSDVIVRRGKEALERQRRGFEDWMAIGEAFRVGQAEVMRSTYTNQPTGKRYERAMGEWLKVHGFHVIDKCTRSHLLKCLEHRPDIERWRATLTGPEQFRFTHPTTVLRKWKSARDNRDQNSPRKPSAVSKLKDANLQLQQENHRMKAELDRGGGDLWSPKDSAEDIAIVMVGKLSPSKAERVARAMLQTLKEKNPAPSGNRSAA